MDIKNRRIKSVPEIAKIRFWNKVDRRKENECWTWQGYKGYKGYGQIVICQKQILTHRYSYELHNGEIPKGMYVCHKCDNPSCVNPKHLFLGTQKENMQDASKKKRCVHPEETICFGEKNGNSKLTDEEIKKIKSAYKPYKITHKQLSKQFNVSEPTIKNILARKSWRRSN